MGDSVSGDTNQVKDEPVLNEGSVVDEVIWVVGDEPILKSDVEVTRLQGEAEGKDARTCTSRRSRIPPTFPEKRQCDSRSECPKRNLKLSRVE